MNQRYRKTPAQYDAERQLNINPKESIEDYLLRLRTESARGNRTAARMMDELLATSAGKFYMASLKGRTGRMEVAS